MDVDNLIFDINSNNLIKSKKFSERQIRGLIFYLRSMILIIPSLFFLHKHFIKKKKVEFTDFKQISDYTNKNSLRKGIFKILQGIFFIFLASFFFFFYRPNNNELTIFLLIEYLKRKKILTDDFNKIIEILKPDKISRYYIFDNKKK